jgi:hypothetical protein
VITCLCRGLHELLGSGGLVLVDVGQVGLPLDAQEMHNVTTMRRGGSDHSVLGLANDVVSAAVPANLHLEHVGASALLLTGRAGPEAVQTQPRLVGWVLR